MNHRAQKSAAFVLATAISLLASNPPQQNDPAAKVTAEIQRLKNLAAEQKPEGDYKDIDPIIKRLLTRADEARKTGRLYAAIEDLARGRLYLEAYIASRVSGEAASMPAFEAAWKKVDVELVVLDKSAKRRTWSTKPVVLQALSESAQGQSLTLVEASRAYATVTDTKAGYYYLGEARVNAEVASFLYTLPLSMKSKRLRLRSWLPELHGLQRKVNAQFVPPKSIERHTDFIRINSAIKLASELDASRLYAGAFYQYLTAVQMFAAMDAESLTEAKQAEVRKSIEAWKAKLKASHRDDSLPQMFVERAELWIDHADGSEVKQEQWKAAQSVLNAVLPAYEQALNAVPQLERESKKLVTVTLVRWPYT